MNHVAITYRRILPCSAPMTAMSGALESSRQALSIRRIMSLIHWSTFYRCSRLKTGLQSERQCQNQAGIQNFHQRISKLDENMYDLTTVGIVFSSAID